MRKYSKYLITILIITAFLCLIILSDTMIKGTKDGVALCFQALIPSIFPFLFISILACNYSEMLSVPFLNSVCKLTGVPLYAKHILILALIGGYPIGAQAVTRSYSSGQITSETAKRLLGFCNNAGPAFIFGLLGTLFQNKFAPVVLWLIHIGTALFVGMLLPNTDKEFKASVVRKHPDKITNILQSSIRVMSIICGWVVLFRVLLELFDHLPIMLPTIPRAIIYGILELSNGCLALVAVENEYIRFITAAALISIGGLCVLLQTVSVAEGVGLELYVPGKIMQTLLSIVFSCLFGSFLYDHPLHIPAFTAACILSFGLAVIIRKKVVALFV